MLAKTTTTLINKYKSISLLLVAIVMTAGSSFAQDNTAPADATITLTQALVPGKIDHDGNPVYTISGQDEITLQLGQGLTIFINNPNSYFKVGYDYPWVWDTAPIIYFECPWVEGASVLWRHESLDKNGDPLSFHFLAVASGTEVVTCTILHTGDVGGGARGLVVVASFPITVHVQNSVEN